MDEGYRILAARYIRRQTKQLAEQLEGVRTAENIEFVHRARVATRRLRAALRMFTPCFKARQVARWQKAIRRTTSKLGDARDRDVQIDFLCRTLSDLNAKECFPGISRILVQVERDRERLQRKVVKAVDRLESKGFLRDLRRLAKKTLRKADSGASDVQTPAVFALSEKSILRQLAELLCQQDSLADPQDQKRHHAMRIAAKRLRYTLEIARPVYPGQLDEAVEAIKRVQSLLGDIHDCDVWNEHLDAFAAKEHARLVALFGHPGRLAHLQPGIDFLRQERRGHRERMFAQLVEFWAELNRRRLWENLNRAVQTRCPEPESASHPVESTVTVSPPAPDPPAAVPSVPINVPTVEPGPVVGDSQSLPPTGKSDDLWRSPRRSLLTSGS